ncbi:Hypothetical protein I596_2966 [Dokdonella koreensis DS-123]|uniref:Uncharacterized protein n=1 Tax=Dokdonella koreensis DS-123 TaxID=1300342 RepID=A0A160DWF7_9GAMM|nr:Hypothetical protein I596_2966 [Dokdonella koreensis DS-123]
MCGARSGTREVHPHARASAGRNADGCSIGIDWCTRSACARAQISQAIQEPREGR